MEELTKLDYSWIQKIILITQFIDEIYNKIHECELNDDKINLQRNIEHLQIILEEEKKLYHQMTPLYEKMPYIIDYIMKEYFDNKICDMEAITLQKMEDRIFRRILIKLDNIFEKQYAILDDKRNAKQYVILGENPKLVNVVSHDTSYFLDLELACQTDFYNSFLCVLNTHLTEKENLEKLLKIKYDVAFINEEIEVDMLDSGFEFPKTYFPRLDWTMYLYGIEESVVREIRQDCGVSEIEHHIGVLLKLHDKEYENEQLSQEMFIRACFIRAALLIVNEQQFSKLQTSFVSVVNSPEYINEFNEDGMSNSLITTCFKKRRVDMMLKKELYEKIK